MTVSFNTIPDDIRIPLFWAEIDASQNRTVFGSQKALIVGQLLPSATQAADTPVFITSEADAKEKFAPGSQLASIVELFRKNNSFTEMWALGLEDDGSAVAATGAVTITGTATADGTLNVYIGGQRVRVGVTTGDTATIVGAALETAIGVNEAAAITLGSGVPVTAENTAGVVAITARNAGALGNDIDLRANYGGVLAGEFTPDGLTVGTTGMADGVTNPDLTGAIAGIGDEPFDFILQPYSDTASLDAWAAEMNDTVGRWSWSRQVFGHVFTVSQNSVANLQTLGSGRNDPHMSVVGFHGSPTPSWEVLGAVGGQATTALINDPSRPLQTLQLLGVRLPDVTDRFTITERNTLLQSGIATLRYATEGVQIEAMTTTYQTNSFGSEDISYLYANVPFQLAYILRTLKGRIEQKFPRHKLADNGTRFAAGQAMVTPSIIRAEIIAAYEEMEYFGHVENSDAFAKALIVERNAANPWRVDVQMNPDLTQQFRIFALKNQFLLQS
ncbi:MAG: phage tail protein [Rhodobiaceae bacterium]|nr:MAG: phage tail protein [Rhodobiaceae bacterium]